MVWDHPARVVIPDYTTANYAFVRDHHNQSVTLYKLWIGVGSFPRQGEVIRIKGAWYKVVTIEWEITTNDEHKEFLTPIIEVE